MGQAKARGSFEQRQAVAIAKAEFLQLYCIEHETRTTLAAQERQP